VKYIHRMIGRVIAGTLIVGSTTGVHAQTELGVEAGLRTDYLRWNIADPFGQPNILSELTWKNVDSHYLNAHVAYKDGDFNLRGDYGYGQITRGDNQDSDYDGNNRTLEFSRSNNKSNGDDVSDAKLGVGIEIANLKLPSIQFTPWVGLSRHQQNLRMTHGVQTVPASGLFDGLNSTYKAEWSGPWAGLNARMQLDGKFVIRASLEHHWADYSGQGNWNLRDCLAHPKSFSHDAKGGGNNIGLSADVELDANLTLTLSMADSRWVTSSGSDTTHLAPDFYTRRDSNGQLACIDQVVLPQDQIFDFSTPLNEVKWNTRSYMVGINMRL